jgi:eukaryotic-like serine/threonine-protein kinase
MNDASYGPGAIIAGQYRLVRKLGEGGMAEVWLAAHDARKQEVAIKLAVAREPHRIVPEILARFRFEAQVAARLGERTRHVVAVHDAGEHDAGPRGGVPFLVMDYVRGCTLADLLAEEGPMHPARFADVLDQAAAALDAAHAVGVVHRDLKPSNLMLAEELHGSVIVKLTDFGLALDPLGSRGYVSPEQIDDDAEIGSPTDVWALGVVAYEALTGEDCFRGATTLQVFGAIRAARFDRPSSVQRGLPRALDAWFARAIALQPSDRFPSAGAMARAFRAVLASEATPRAPLFAASAVVVLLAVATAGLAAYRVCTASPPAPVGARAATFVSVPAPAPTPSTAATDTATPPVTASAPAEAPSARTAGTALASGRARAPTAHVSGGAAPAPAHRAPDEQVLQAPDKAPPEKAPPEETFDPSEL